MIYLLYGSDTYRSRRKLNAIMAEYRQKNGSGLDFHRIDLEENDIFQLKLALESNSLFTSKKLVVVENVFKCLSLDVLTSVLRSVENSKEIIIVLWSGEAGREKLKLFQNLNVKVQEFKSLSGSALARWIQEEAQKRGIRLYPAILAHLQTFENDLWALANELDKISAGGEAFIQNNLSRKKTVFDLADTFFISRQQGLHNLFQLWHQGEDESAVFGYLANHSRKLITIKNYAEKKQLPPAKYGIHPFIVKKSSPVLRQIPVGKLESYPRKFFEEDLKVKTGSSRHRDSLIQLTLNN